MRLGHRTVPGLEQKWNPPHKLLFSGLRPMVLPFTLLKSLFWHSSSSISKIWQLLSSKGLKNRLCETSQISSVFEFSREPIAPCVFRSRAWRGWSFQYTKAPRNRGQRAGAAKLGFCQVLRNKLALPDICISRGKNESPKWVSKLEQENRHWKYLRFAAGSFLPLSLLY